MVGQFRIWGVLRQALRIWWRNALGFTLLSVLLAAPLALWLALGDGIHGAELMLPVRRNYELLALQGLSVLVAPMLAARVVQSLGGVELSLLGSVWCSGRGLVVELVLILLGLLVSFIPVLGIIASIALNWMSFVAIPAAVTERLNPLPALERSSNLLRGQYWRALALLAIAGVLAGIPVLAAREWITMSRHASTQTTLAWLQELRPYALAVVGLSTVVMPFQGIVRAVAYVQLRRDSPGPDGDVAQVFE